MSFINERRVCEDRDRVLHPQDDAASSSASTPSPRRRRPPYAHILLGERKPSDGNLLARTFGIATPEGSLQKTHQKEKVGVAEWSDG